MRYTTHVFHPTAIMALVYLCVPASGFAKCTGDQMEKLIDKGFSKQEIKQLCSGQSRESEAPDDVIEENEDATTSTTCKYTMGPKAGRTQYFRPGTPGLTPAYVGGPCTDGMGSMGMAVPDKRR